MYMLLHGSRLVSSFSTLSASSTSGWWLHPPSQHSLRLALPTYFLLPRYWPVDSHQTNERNTSSQRTEGSLHASVLSPLSGFWSQAWQCCRLVCVLKAPGPGPAWTLATSLPLFPLPPTQGSLSSSAALSFVPEAREAFLTWRNET